MEKIITIANGAASSLYGCIGVAVMDHIESKFPPNYFKYHTLSTELASRNIRRQFGTNTSTEIIKREKPYLVVQPMYSTIDSNDPFQNIPLTTNFDNLHMNLDTRALFPIIQDKTYGYNLKFKMNRDRVEFDVTLVVSTLHQQLDMYRALKNIVFWERTNNFRIALESVIPKTMIEMIGAYCGMDINNNPEYIPVLTKRMNMVSGYPITYKMRNASHQDEWYMYYTHDTQLTFYDLSMDEGNMKNMSPESYKISFKVSCDFNLPGLFLISAEKPPMAGEIQFAMAAKYESNVVTDIIPFYSITNFYAKYPQERDGMQLYGTSIFKADRKIDGTDTVNLKDVIEGDYIRAIEAHKNFYPDNRTLSNVIILKDGKELIEKVDYNIAWETLNVILNDVDESVTYRVIIYFNLEMINEILENSEYFRNYDTSNLRENILGPGISDYRTYLTDNSGNPPEGKVMSHKIYLKDHVPSDVNPEDVDIVIPDKSLSAIGDGYKIPDGIDSSRFSVYIPDIDKDTLFEEPNFTLESDVEGEIPEEKIIIHPDKQDEFGLLFEGIRNNDITYHSNYIMRDEGTKAGYTYITPDEKPISPTVKPNVFYSKDGKNVIRTSIEPEVKEEIKTKKFSSSI